MSAAKTDASLTASSTKSTIKPPSRATPQLSANLDAQKVFLFLVAFRLLNALTVQTFFQPDEYFQALEPGWQWAFGAGNGAWITWVRLGILFHPY
jgi:GPI mannosyltransferase 3